MVDKALELLKDSQDLVFERWEKLVRQRVKAARTTEAMALRNHLPLIYQEIIEAAELLLEGKFRGREAAQQFVENPAHHEHGRLRASTKGYSVDSLIQEYYVLEEVIIDRLDEKGLWERNVAEAIHYLVQHSVTVTAEVFTESLELMQQRMLGTLVHDIRTPLTAATMAGDLISEGTVDDKMRVHLDGVSRDGVARALSMLSGLLDTVMAEAGDGLMMDFREADFAAEFKNAAMEARNIYGEIIKADSVDQEVRGVFDPAVFRRILENLISNAVRYGTAQQPIKLGFSDEGENVRLSVHNLGNPISPERRKKIFEFFSERVDDEHKRVQDSWGLGLSFIRLAVDGHNGTVDLESDEENGTVFIVTLPRYGNEIGKVRTRLVEHKD